MNEGYDGDRLGVGIREYSGDGLWDRRRCGGTYGVSLRRSMFGVDAQGFSGDNCRKLCPLTAAVMPFALASPTFEDMSTTAILVCNLRSGLKEYINQ